MIQKGEGLLIHLHPLSETKVIASLFTAENGLVKGCVRLSKKSFFRVGAFYLYQKKARLADQLGTMEIEPSSLFSTLAFDSQKSLLCLNSMCSLLYLFVAEHEPTEWLYSRLLLHLSCIQKSIFQHYFLFEYDLLSHAGYHLDLNQCAVTGKTEHLFYISPKTGRAVTKEVGDPYKDQLFVLSDLFKIQDSAKAVQMNEAALVLEFFMKKWLEEHRHKPILPFERGLVQKTLFFNSRSLS